MTMQEAVELLNQGGVLAAAIFYIVGFYREIHVTGRQYRRLEVKCEKLEQAAFDTLALSRDLVQLIKDLDPERAARAVNTTRPATQQQDARP